MYHNVLKAECKIVYIIEASSLLAYVAYICFIFPDVITIKSLLLVTCENFIYYYEAIRHHLPSIPLWFK